MNGIYYKNITLQVKEILFSQKHYLRKMICQAIYLIVFSLFLANFSFAVQYKLKVNVPRANIREEPNISSKILTSVTLGTILVSEKKLDNWFCVIVPEQYQRAKIGYIHKNIVEILKEIEEINPVVEKVEINKLTEPEKTSIKEETKREVAWRLSEIPSQIQAQKKEKIKTKQFEKKYSFGLKAGLNSSNFYSGFFLVNKKDSDQIPLLGFYFGGVVKFQMNRTFGIQTEVIFSQKGIKSNYSSEIYRINYIEVPVFVDISIPLNQNIFLFFDLGPYLAIKLGETVNRSSQANWYGVELGGSPSQFKSIDFGGILGTGIGYSIGNGLVQLNLRYGFGLIEVSSGKDRKSVV